MNHKGSASIIAIVGIIVALLVVAGYFLMHSSSLTPNTNNQVANTNLEQNTPVPTTVTQQNVDTTLNQTSKDLDQSLSQVDNDLKSLDQATSQSNDTSEGF